MRAPTVSNIVQQLKSCVTKHLHHPIWLYIDSNPPNMADGLPEPEPEQPPTI